MIWDTLLYIVILMYSPLNWILDKANLVVNEHISRGPAHSKSALTPLPLTLFREAKCHL